MANVALYWDTNKSLTMEPASDWQARRARDADVHRADSGHSETAVRERFDRVRVLIENFQTSSWWDSLVAWWAWAEQGKSYGVALDSSDRVDTTLSAIANAGATSITVASGTGIVAGRRYKVRDADGRYQEIVTVDISYTSGTTVPLASGLLWARAAGAILRSLEWYPAMETEDDEFPVVEMPGMTWVFDHRCREAK